MWHMSPTLLSLGLPWLPGVFGFLNPRDDNSYAGISQCTGPLWCECTKAWRDSAALPVSTALGCEESPPRESQLKSIDTKALQL